MCSVTLISRAVRSPRGLEVRSIIFFVGAMKSINFFAASPVSSSVGGRTRWSAWHDGVRGGYPRCHRRAGLVAPRRIGRVRRRGTEGRPGVGWGDARPLGHEATAALAVRSSEPSLTVRSLARQGGGHSRRRHLRTLRDDRRVHPRVRSIGRAMHRPLRLRPEPKRQRHRGVPDDRAAHVTRRRARSHPLAATTRVPEPVVHDAARATRDGHHRRRTLGSPRLSIAPEHVEVHPMERPASSIH